MDCIIKLMTMIGWLVNNNYLLLCTNVIKYFICKEYNIFILGD